MTFTADLPDWESLSNPNQLSAAAFQVSPGSQDVLVSLSRPWRVWGAWLCVTVGSTAAYPAGFGYWGAKIKDSAGIDLIRVNAGVMAASQFDTATLFVNLGGYNVFDFGNVWAVELDTDASIGNLNGRAQGGIFYSVP
jgi:hypothetical protein